MGQPEREEDGVEAPRRAPFQDVGRLKITLSPVTRWRARAIISGAASIAVTLRA